MKIASVIFILLLLTGRASAHDIHISYGQAELKPDGLHVKVSYYKDDFTKAVKSWYQGKADHYSSELFRQAEFEYVKNYLRVWDDAHLAHQVLPNLRNISDDGISLIFELEFSSNHSNAMVVDQRVLFKEYSDQMNIFFIKSTAKEENHIFTPSKPTFLFKP